MKFSLSSLVIPTTAFILATGLLGGRAAQESSADVKRLFRAPPREYSTGPLWVWNDLLTDEQIRSTLRDLAEQQVKQVWVHPRPGLMTPYLGKEWFDLWRTSLDEAANLDMNVWIYDENSYPSGFAGGWVPELMPESRGRGLNLQETKGPVKWGTNTIAVYRLDERAAENVSERARQGEALPEGRYLVATELRSGNSPWHGDRCYVNLLSPGVTEKFIEVTLEAYKREVGGQFGKRIPGVFTDEPNIIPAGGLPWSEVLAAEFQKRWGYDLLAHLPSLRLPLGDWQKVRHNYFQVLHEQFVERWARPNFEWCQQNNLAWTGHYWEHDWPHCVGVPDNMAMYAWHQWPAIDCLMNQYAEHTHAQFGNARMVKELSSVANQMGWKRTLCEVYGAGGWDLRFEDMKRIGDWLQVLGVNTLNQHLDYVTLRGARKRDHPLSFSYHAPWWKDYHLSATYFARLSTALSQGEQLNRILVLSPTTTAWMYQGDGAKLSPIGDQFFRLIMDLEAQQAEYDLGSEDIIERHGRARPGSFSVGQREYDTVVLPPLTENLNASTVALLERFLDGAAGGEVICLGSPPERMDGQPSDRVKRLAERGRWRQMEKGAPGYLAARSASAGGVAIQRAAGDQGILFHHRRTLADGELLFLVNTSIEFPSKGTIDARLRSVEQWDLATGETRPYPFAALAGGVRTQFELPPSGSLLLFLSQRSGKPFDLPPAQTVVLKAIAAPDIRREQPNVLTVDYVDVTAGGERKENAYFYPANQFVWQKNGMPRNPWDSAVQFRDELIRKTFPPDSGFTASYRFTIQGPVPPPFWVVIERPDLYTINVNGNPIRHIPGQWWLDKAFGKLDITGLARQGENVVTLTASPFTMFHELEPIYVLGNFRLRPEPRGFTIVPDAPIELGRQQASLAHGNNPDGAMWLSGGLGYQGGGNDGKPWITFDLGEPTTVAKVRIWNYNESHVHDLTGRGARKITLTGRESGESAALPLGQFELEKANGAGELPQDFALTAGKPVRTVTIELLSNHHGVEYPASGEPVDNGFVGLAEVQFLNAAGEPLKGLKVQAVSSELRSHNRLARHVTDGSGIGAHQEGWNEQGHPFYAAGVAYLQRFQVAETKGQFAVHLPKWYGSIARVKVNGADAGCIDAPPWERDVTRWIRKGQNEVEVTVVGTLKNTLGPHHGSPSLGTAWPGQFQNGPNPGPPPGRRYHTVGYGLFEPFVLKHRR